MVEDCRLRVGGSERGGEGGGGRSELVAIASCWCFRSSSRAAFCVRAYALLSSRPFPAQSFKRGVHPASGRHPRADEEGGRMTWEGRGFPTLLNDVSTRLKVSPCSSEGGRAIPVHLSSTRASLVVKQWCTKVGCDDLVVPRDGKTSWPLRATLLLALSAWSFPVGIRRAG